MPLSTVVGVSALSNSGELLLILDLLSAEGADTVTGVMGRNEKLLEEDLAGLIVVEWRIFPGSLVMLIGSDLNAVWDVFAGLEGRGDEAIDAGDIVKKVSPIEIVVLPLNLEGSKEALGVVEVVFL